MLYTDGPFVTVADLSRIESEIPDVAATESIDVTDHIANALDEFQSWLMMKNEGMSGWIPPASQPLTPSLAITALVHQSSNRTRFALSQVVVSDTEYPGQWGNLKRVAVYWAIELFYRQASRRREKDRYEEKRDDYRDELQHKYIPILKRKGTPIIYRPLACPGAYLEDGSGTWSNSNLSLLLGLSTGASDPEYVVVATWIDSTTPTNNESAPSTIATIRVHAGDQVIVDISNLRAPDGTFRPSTLANVPFMPLAATGWNIYAGLVGASLTLQNATPIPYATKSYTLAAGLTTTGRVVGQGQYANQRMPMLDMIQRF